MPTASSSQPIAAPRSPSTVYMTPNLHPSSEVEVNSNKRSPTQPRTYRDAGVPANSPAPSQHKTRSRHGASRLSPLPVDRRHKGRSECVSDKDKGEVPFEAYEKVLAFEERVSGFDQQLNNLRKLVDETLVRSKSIGQRDDKGKYPMHRTNSNLHKSPLHQQQQISEAENKTNREVERETQTLELQVRLQDAQAKIQELFSKHEEQKFQLDRAVASGPPEDWKALASQSKDLLGRLDSMSQHIGSSIHSYLEKYDQHLRDTTSHHWERLQHELESNLGHLSEETKRKGEFEENMLQEYKNSTAWYQREIENLQGQKSEKEASLEQFRLELLNQRQRLNDEHADELKAKATEHARVMEKQHRNQQRLVSWYARRMDENVEKWQTRLAAAEGEKAHLLDKINNERLQHEREKQELTVNLTRVKHDLDAVSKLKQDLEMCLSEGKQTDPLEFQVLRDKLADHEAKSREYTEEIKQLCAREKELNDRIRDSEDNLERCERELLGYREKLENFPREMQELQESHHTATRLLKEDFTKQKGQIEEEHQVQIRAGRERIERLEQQTESLRNSKIDQTEQHCKALEDNTNKWQEEINKRRVEWQKELDQSYELVREVKATTHSSESKIDALEQDAQRAQGNIETLTSKLDESYDAIREGKATIQSRESKIQALEQEAQKAQNRIEALILDLEKSYEQTPEGKAAIQLKEANIQELIQKAQQAQNQIKTLTLDLDKSYKQTREEKATIQSRESKIQALERESEEAQNRVKALTVELEKSYEQTRKEKAAIQLSESKIKTLEQESQAAQDRVKTLTLELDKSYEQTREGKEAIHSANLKIQTLELEVQGAQGKIQKLTSELDESCASVNQAKATLLSKDTRIEALELEARQTQNQLQILTSELDQAKQVQQTALKAQEDLKKINQGLEKDLDTLRQSLKAAKDEKKTLVEQVAKLDQNTSKETETIESNLKATRQKLAAKVKEASAALQELEEKKQQLTTSQSKADRAQKQYLESQTQIKQKDIQLEKLKLALKAEREKSKELSVAQKAGSENDARATELTAKLKGMEVAHASYNKQIFDQNKLLLQRNKTIRALEQQLVTAAQKRQAMEETMKEALAKEETKRLKEETKRNIIFNEFQKLRRDIRVMCRIRPSKAGDGTILEYETSEGKFHSKPAGLEIISQKSRYGTSTQVEDRTKHYSFDRVFEAEETNEDVWLEISQFVQSFVEGRQVTIFCYGQTATGKTYTMSNSEHALDANGEPILTNEGIMPRSKALIFEEAARRREKGWTVAVRGCCYEVYVKEIRQLLPGKKIKNKTLNPAEPPWWSVRDPEYTTLHSVADFDDMFESAMESRTFAETTSNSSSSRSHFILYLEFESKSPTMKQAQKGSLCLVDLAGSEDPHKASAVDLADDQGTSSASTSRRGSEDSTALKKIREQRLREGIAINQSLRVLRKSIPKIRNPTAPNGKPTLEGGDEESSTLAKLLGPCLGRESMVLMFVMINLSVDSLTETKATLESGKEIAEVKLVPTKRPVSSASTPSNTDKKAETLRTPTTPKKPMFGGRR